MKKISDKERLDWLAKHSGRIENYPPDGNWWVVAYESQDAGAERLEPMIFKKTARQAIDSAILAQRKARKGEGVKPGERVEVLAGARFLRIAKGGQRGTMKWAVVTLCPAPCLECKTYKVPLSWVKGAK